MTYKRKRILGRIGLYYIVLMICFVIGFPLYWMVISSFTPLSEMFSIDIHLIPRALTFDNFLALFAQTKFLVFLRNSLFYATGTIATTTVVATLAGYGLSKLAVGQKGLLARVILFSYMFPPMLLAIPYFMIFRSLGLLDTYPGLIISQTARALPFCLWLIWLFFESLPSRYEECAYILGASRLRTIFEISVRLALPGVISAAIFAFGISWGDYTFALLLTSTDEMRPLSIGLASFAQRLQVHWGYVMAGSVLVSIPPFLLVLFLQKYLLRGYSPTRL